MRQNGRAAGITADLHGRLAEAVGFSVPVRLWDGTLLGPPEAPFRLVLNHPWSARAILLPPSDLALGEAYLHGDVDIDGDAIAAVVAADLMREASLGVGERLALLRRLLRLPRPPRRPDSRRARLRGRRHSQQRDRAAIAFHYDLPEAFYAAFLDRALVYSCAYFADGDDDLDRAQARKLEVVCRKLRLERDSRLVDIGCGFGSLLLHAARHHGARGLGVTLSETQAAAARERIAAEGLEDRVEVRIQDYRELEGRFDAVASIGMVEHVGPDRLPEYFAAAHRLTAPGGLCLTHAIITGDPHRVRRGSERDFVSTYVFPDGGLAPAWRLVRDCQEAGFELLDVEQLRPSYARTLRTWVANLEANHDAAVAAASEVDYRIWRLYMAGSSAAFASRHLGVVQVLGGRDASVPLGRRWMLPRDDAARRAA